MRALLLGGTGFLGRHIVREAISCGHEVTLFHRGRTEPDLFASEDVASIHGNRDGELDRLPDEEWDLVIDTCAYVPRVARATARSLRDRVDRYVFISTQSVYADLETDGLDETADVSRIDDPDTETIDGRTYGALKALCEEEITTVFGERAIHVRPGLIVGPNDHTDRFTYWPVRIATEEAVVAPPPATPVEFTDARDIAAWLWRALDGSAVSGVSGTYDVSGPTPPRPTFRQLLEACQQCVDSPAEIVWATREFLDDAGVAPWTDLPVWFPKTGFATRPGARAAAAGLTFRPMAETITDTLEWAHESGRIAGDLRAGLSPDRNRELVDQLRGP